MSTDTAVSAALVAVTVTLAATVTVTATHRWWRHRRARRRQSRLAAVRPSVLAMVTGDGEGFDLDRIDGLNGGLLEDLAVDLLPKVRGEARDAIVALLDRRGVLDAARRRTTSRDPVARARAAELLGAAGVTGAVPEILRLLDDPDLDVTLVAVRALGKLGLPAAATHLLSALDASQKLPAGAVAMALLRLGPAAIEPLRTALLTGGPTVRATTAEVLGASRAVGATDDLLHTLNSDAELEVRIRCARALGVLGSPRAVGTLVEYMCVDTPAPLRAVAARALGQIGDPAAVAALVVALSDTDHRVASNAAGAMAAMGARGTANLEEVAAGEGPPAAYAREALAFAGLATSRAQRVRRSPGSPRS